MTWGKIDDKLHSHPKAEDAGLEAMGLWAMALSYCAAYLTDGLVTAARVSRLAGERGEYLAGRLVDAGLWEARPEGGWQFHDWADYQPTKAGVEAEREKKASSGRAGGLARAGRIPPQAPNDAVVLADAQALAQAPATADAQALAQADAKLRARVPSRPVPSRPDQATPDPPEAALAGVSVGLPDGPTLHEMARRCAPANSYAAKMLAKLDGGEVLTKGQRDALKKIDGEEHGAERPPGQPDPSHETFARAYSAGMTDATGDPFTPPTDANAQQVFRAVLPVHAIGPDRQPLTGDALLAWIRASAAEWRRCVKPEDTRYTSGFVPAKWQTWLNAGRPGSAPPPARLLRPIVHDPIAEMARRRALPVEDE